MMIEKLHRRLAMLCLVLGGAVGHLETTSAQLVDVSNTIVLETQHVGGFLGAGVSFVDFNGDYIDDLSFADHQGDLKFFEGTGDEAGFIEVDLELPEHPHEAKMMLWGDIDNDGDQDLFVTYRLAANKLFINNGVQGFEDVSATCGINQSARKSYGASFGDYNKDGLLDLFICNYTASQDEYPFNELYKNNGDGTFSETTSEQGLDAIGVQSFQSQWVDFNDDGLLDLHVIRDRTIYENYYFEQQGTGSLMPFIERGAETGLDIMINCMSTSVADYDCDFDSDVYLTAFTEDMNWLLINEDGIFGIDDASGDVPMNDLQVDAICWAANWLDVDNNGWEDLHVANGFSVFTNYPMVLDVYNNEPDALFYNEGGQFTESQEAQFQTTSVISFATAAGDYNRDGFPDLVSHRVGEYAQILRGTPNTNHWIKIWLEGTDSNRDAVGSKIRIWAGDHAQSRMTFAGENYLGQNSRWEAFGLGDATAIDSIQVTWPTGLISTFTDVVIDQHWILSEDGESTQLWQIDPCSSGGICQGCIYPEACNYNPQAEIDDGSCDFDCYDGPSSCGPGSVWSASLEMCVTSDDCQFDFDGSGYITIADLLYFLVAFNQPCPN
ncbi:MAG: CRTAC1 family protein [Bacteroidetes bacterium]|nr:CRTAC1 family protein [Bacteroidota bacterium]MDA1337052.1 CRTAC1 family protein [Bacteroidota bacterium]